VFNSDYKAKDLAGLSATTYRFSNLPRQKLKYSHGGKTVYLQIEWNTRQGRWYISVLNKYGVQIISRTKMSPNSPILVSYSHIEELPDGLMFLFGPKRQAGRSDMFSAYRLMVIR
jgi:hypothetical protein